eukprot:26460-Pyramimonas_sp.AAC.1
MRVFLGTVSADTIARAALMMVGGVRHYLADQKTLFRGTNMVGSGLSAEESGKQEGEAMRFLGYNKAVWQAFMLVNGGARAPSSVLNMDESMVQQHCMVYADEEQLCRGPAGQAGQGGEARSVAETVPLGGDQPDQPVQPVQNIWNGAHAPAPVPDTKTAGTFVELLSVKCSTERAGPVPTTRYQERYRVRYDRYRGGNLFSCTERKYLNANVQERPFPP